jgi:hypothetical protein
MSPIVEEHSDFKDYDDEAEDSEDPQRTACARPITLAGDPPRGAHSPIAHAVRGPSLGMAEAQRAQSCAPAKDWASKAACVCRCAPLRPARQTCSASSP